VTEPLGPPVPAFPTTSAVAFQPVSLANGSNVLISADPRTSKLPLKAVSPASQTAIEVMKLLIVPAVVLATLV
jgi:hypothetical protein